MSEDPNRPLGTSLEKVNIAHLFNAINDQGKLLNLPMHYNIPTIDQASHIQGATRMHESTWVFSHNGVRTDGWLFVFAGNKLSKYDVVCDGFKHPGGLDASGNLLVVPVEADADGHPQSIIQFYSLVNSHSAPALLPCTIYRTPGKGAVVGGASCAAIGRPFRPFVLVLYTSNYETGERKAFDVYQSNGSDPTAYGFAFHYLFRSSTDYGYDNITALVDSDGNLFVVGFRSEKDSSSFADFMDLYLIDMQNQKAQLVAGPRHMYTHDGNFGALKPHFRYGAFAATPTSKVVEVYCTERNTHLLGDFSLNVFPG